jgi:translocator protein
MNNLLLVVLTLLAVFGVNYYIMRDYNFEWYDKLNKPSWTPSGGFIGIMWTIIYISVGISWYLALRNIDSEIIRTFVSVLFLINLAFNVSWSYFFFGQQNTNIPMAILGILIITLIMLIITIYPYSKVASILLFIYLIWLFIAGSLNYYIDVNN